MNPVVVAAVGWVLLGLAVGLWMVRRGHDPRWVVVAVALGPVFVPIALERVERRPRLATFGPTCTDREDGSVAGLRVLVGLDGSTASQEALTRALEILGPRCGLLVLAEVLRCEATDDVTHADITDATQRLAAAADSARDVVGQVRSAVLAGPPGEALRWFAEDQDMHLVVVGRRGRGLSQRLLGSVSTDLVRRSHLPVLVIEPGYRVPPPRRLLRRGAPLVADSEAKQSLS